MGPPAALPKLRDLLNRFSSCLEGKATHRHTSNVFSPPTVLCPWWGLLFPSHLEESTARPADVNPLPTSSFHPPPTSPHLQATTKRTTYCPRDHTVWFASNSHGISPKCTDRASGPSASSFSGHRWQNPIVITNTAQLETRVGPSCCPTGRLVSQPANFTCSGRKVQHHSQGSFRNSAST